METEIQGLIIRYLEGSSTDDDLEKLQEWISLSGENRRVFTEIQHTWLLTRVYDPDSVWQKVAGRLKNDNRKSRYLFWIKISGYAAAVLIVLFTGIYIARLQQSAGIPPMLAGTIEPGSKKAILILASNEKLELGTKEDTLIGNLAIRNQNHTLSYKDDSNNMPTVEYNRLITPRGGEYSVILSDGTKVWLNAESELKYPIHFSGNNREVYLRGEAYFSVTHKGGKPFTVYSGDTKVTVLGTEFNIRNYKNEMVAATLVKGSVVVADSKHNESRLLPGQQARFLTNGIEVAGVETTLYTTWKDGYFVYQDRTLDDILKELSRWYDFTYFYQDKELASNTLTAKLKKFDSADRIFEILEETGRFQFIRNGKTVTVVAK